MSLRTTGRSQGRLPRSGMRQVTDADCRNVIGDRISAGDRLMADDRIRGRLAVADGAGTCSQTTLVGPEAPRAMGGGTSSRNQLGYAIGVRSARTASNRAGQPLDSRLPARAGPLARPDQLTRQGVGAR